MAKRIPILYPELRYVTTDWIYTMPESLRLPQVGVITSEKRSMIK